LGSSTWFTHVLRHQLRSAYHCWSRNHCALHCLSEVVHENVRKLEVYVEEMASGDTVSGSINIQKVQDDVLKLWSVVKSLPEISSDQKNHIKSLYEAVVCSLHNNPDPSPRTPRSRRSSSQFLRPQVTGVTAVTSLSSDKMPLLHLKHNQQYLVI
jgi:fatty acid synthase subunit beta